MSSLAPAEKLKTFGELLSQKKHVFAAVLPRHMNPERLIKVALTAMNRQPLLMQCTQASLFQSLLIAAQLGLEIDGVLGSAYMVPFRNKQGQYEAQFIPGYRGLIDLARRSGQIKRIEAHVVREKDKFEFAYGLEMKLAHTPTWPGDGGEIVGAYAIAELTDGSTQVEVMSRAEIDGIRGRSKAKDSGPWVTDYAEMARKTVVRRLVKYLPLSVELATALEVENRSEAGETIVDMLPADLPMEALPAPEPTKGDTIKAKLRQSASKAPEPPQEAISEETQEETLPEAQPPVLGESGDPADWEKVVYLAGEGAKDAAITIYESIKDTVTKEQRQAMMEALSQ